MVPFACTRRRVVTATLTSAIVVFAVKCILQWATGRKDASCPTCKAPFDSLLVHRDVDGALSDVPIRETVAFLARAPWYVAWAREQSQIRELTRQHAAFRSVDVAASERSPLAIAQEEWAEEAMYGYFEDQYDDDDEELEDYYVGRRGRPTFGNRPWGPGGFVSSGRRRAAPVQPPRAGKGGASSSGSGTSSSGKGGGAKSGGKGGGGSSAGPSAQGRRAKRNAKRAAAGYGDD